MTRSFGLAAPSALEAFKNAAEKFKDDELNEDLARDCACKACCYPSAKVGHIGTEG